MVEQIFHTACGGKIEAATDTRLHLSAHQGVIDYLPEAMNKISLPNDLKKLCQVIDLGRIIGRSSLLETVQIELNTSCWFAKRQERLGPSRVILDIDPTETSVISIIANAITPDRYKLVSAWFGAFAPKEPWDTTLISEPSAFKESLDFWCCHALAYNHEGMDEPFESTWEEIINSHYKPDRGGIK